MAVRKFMTNNLVKEHDMYVEFMRKRNEEMKNDGHEPTEVLFYKRGLLGTRTDYAKNNYISICKWHCIIITYNIWYSICAPLYSSRIQTNEPYKDLVDVPDDALKKFEYRVEQSIKNARCDYNSKKGRANGTYDTPRYLAMFWTYLDIVKDTETQRFYPTADTRKRAAKIFGYAENDDPFIMNGKYYNRANKKEKPMVEQTPENITDILNTFIHDIGLSVRTSNPLARSGIITFGDLREKTIDDLMSIRNFGLRSLREVIDVLAKYGYYYPKHPNADADAGPLDMYEKDQLPMLMTGAEDEPKEEKTKPIDNTDLIAENMELKQRLNVHMWQSLEKLNNLEKENAELHERNKELSKENIDLKRERAQLNGRINELSEANSSFIEEIAAEEDIDILSLIKSIMTEMRNNKVSYITLQIDGYSINITKESEE